MPEHMKAQSIRGNAVRFTITVPKDKAWMFLKMFRTSLELAGLEQETNEEGEEIYVPEESTPAIRLRGLRTREGITQQQLADSLGIGQSRVADYESGTRRISVAMAKKIASVYGVSYKCFL